MININYGHFHPRAHSVSLCVMHFFGYVMWAFACHTYAAPVSYLYVLNVALCVRGRACSVAVLGGAALPFPLGLTMN